MTWVLENSWRIASCLHCWIHKPVWGLNSTILALTKFMRIILQRRECNATRDIEDRHVPATARRQKRHLRDLFEIIDHFFSNYFREISHYAELFDREKNSYCFYMTADKKEETDLTSRCFFELLACDESVSKISWSVSKRMTIPTQVENPRIEGKSERLMTAMKGWEEWCREGK